MRFPRSAPGVLIFLLLVTAQSVRADPVHVVSAIVALDGGNLPVWSFTTADSTVSFTSPVSPAGFAIFRNCWLTTCQPGMLFDPGADVDHQQLNVSDVATFAGVRINGVLDPDAVVDGQLTIRGPLTPLPVPSSTDSQQLVFSELTVDASYRLYDDPSRTAQLMHAALLGQGTLRANFHPESDGGLAWNSNARYDFEAIHPVPEPGTMLLFASGAGMVVQRARGRLTQARRR